MLFRLQPRTNVWTSARRALGLAAGILAALGRRRADAAYLDGMRASELEDLGLRRGSDGRYRFFG